MSERLLYAMELIDIDNNPQSVPDSVRAAFLELHTTEVQRKEMEASLRKCTEEELETLCMGDQAEAELFIPKYGLEMAHSFLGFYFDHFEGEKWEAS